MLIKSVSHCIFLLFLMWFSEEMTLIQLPWLAVHLLVLSPTPSSGNVSNCQQILPNLERKKTSRRHYHFY